MGCVFLPPTEENEHISGTVILIVDGAFVANAMLNPISSDTAGYYMVSIDTIWQLEPGQIVSVKWVPSRSGGSTKTASLWSYGGGEGGVTTHFTGQLLGSPTMQ